MVAAAQQESQHEIVALGRDKLVLNEANWGRMRAEGDSQAPNLVVSFLGDTSAGKSHTIRALMSSDEQRPFIQEASRQARATTFNVNLFPSSTLVSGVMTNLVDYEGENGSETPVMARAIGVNMAPSIGRSRHELVNQFFPKLAYTTSDAIVMVSREPFFNRHYLDRCIELAKRANDGVTNVDMPTLILVGNKLPGEECLLDVKEATDQFYGAWAEEAYKLDRYFSAVICLYVPHRRQSWIDPTTGQTVDGKRAFAGQIRKLRNLIRALKMPLPEEGAGNGLHSTRQITEHQGIWFELLPRVVSELNHNRAVNVAALLETAWSSAMSRAADTEEQALDIFLAFNAFLRPPDTLSIATGSQYCLDVLARFAEYRELAMEVATRLVACRLRRLSRLYHVERKIRRHAGEVLEKVGALVDSMSPCTACLEADVKPLPMKQSGRGTASLAPPDPPLCLQAAKTHATHRSSCRVLSKWGISGFTMTAGIPHNHTWPGEHRPAGFEPFAIPALVQRVVRLVNMPPAYFLAELVALQRQRTSSRLSVGFVQLLVPPSFTRATEFYDLLPCGGVRPPAAAAAATSAARASALDASMGSLLPAPAGRAPPERAGLYDADCLEPLDRPLPTRLSRDLRLVSHLTAPAEMPYCVGCGLKLNEQSVVARRRRAEAEAGAKEAPAEAAGDAAGPAGGSGVLGFVSRWFSGGSWPQATPAPSSAPPGPSSPPRSTALPTTAASPLPSLASGATAIDADGPGAAVADEDVPCEAAWEGASALDGEEGDDEALGRRVPAPGCFAERGWTPPQPAAKHNVWFGLCPRCWVGAYGPRAAADARRARIGTSRSTVNRRELNGLD